MLTGQGLQVKVCHLRPTPANNVNWWVDCLCQMNQLRKQSGNNSKSCWKGKLARPTGFTEAIHFLQPFRATAQCSLLGPREQRPIRLFESVLEEVSATSATQHAPAYFCGATGTDQSCSSVGQNQLAIPIYLWARSIHVTAAAVCDKAVSRNNDNVHKKDTSRETFIESEKWIPLPTGLK